jgi:hypothetical protein
VARSSGLGYKQPGLVYLVLLVLNNAAYREGDVKLLD